MRFAPQFATPFRQLFLAILAVLILSPPTAPAIGEKAAARGGPPEDKRKSPALAWLAEGGLFSLDGFAASIRTGEGGVVRGVYAPGVFAYPVVQQPEDDDIFVSNRSGLVTQFRRAGESGVIALLAHNFLAGLDFYALAEDQDVWIIFGDGEMDAYQVTGTYRFRKLDPESLHSDLVDLRNGEVSTPTEVYNRFYRGDRQVVFQTCLEGEGRLNWGLLFVVASPRR